VHYARNILVFAVWGSLIWSCQNTDPVEPTGAVDDGDGVSLDSVQNDTVSTADSLYFLALGDSYTIGASVAVEERWPNILVDSLRANGFLLHNARIIARTGWTTGRLRNEIATADLDRKYDLVSLLIGVNNQFTGSSFAGFQRDFEILLDTCLSLAKDKNGVFVLSIPDYGATPFGSGNAQSIGMEIDQYNAYIEATCLKYEIKYFNVTDISRMAAADPTLIAIDGLHPSGKMYALWVDRMLPSIMARLRMLQLGP